MKTVILLTFVALSYGAKLDRAYLPPQHAQSSSGAEYLETPIVGQIVVDDAAVYHQSDNEQHQQVNPGYVRIGSQGSAHAHVTEATIVPQYQQHGYVVGSHASSLAHGAAATIVDSHPEAINGYVNIGSHSSAHAHEVVENVHYQGQNLKVEHIPDRAQAAGERSAAILRQDYKNDGSHYAYVYETENGIFGEEKGVAEHGTRAHGAYSYTGDDGVQYSITYTADENGFHPQGDHLPTPHPIPEEILKSLEQNARDEAAGIYDDGSYRPEKYGEQATYIEHVEHETPTHVVVNDHSASAHEEIDAVVTNPIVIPEAALQRPVFRNPALEQVVVNIPTHIVASNVNRGYLPPGHQILEKRSSQKGKPVFGSKSRQPTLTLKKVKKN